MTNGNEDLIKDIDSGKKKVVSKIEYLINYWTPIVTVLSFLVAGVFWFANANGRMFTNENMKYETETNTIDARHKTIDKLDERYIKRTEIVDLKDVINELKTDIKDLRKELTKNRKY